VPDDASLTMPFAAVPVLAASWQLCSKPTTVLLLQQQLFLLTRSDVTCYD
jgi:hypothetical protein